MKELALVVVVYSLRKKVFSVFEKTVTLALFSSQVPVISRISGHFFRFLSFFIQTFVHSSFIHSGS